MERLLFLWDELDDALGLLRHAWLTTVARLTPAPARLKTPRRPWIGDPKPSGT